MKQTLILCVTHRGLYEETRASLDELGALSGGETRYVEAKGLANICKARSLAFDQAHRMLSASPELDTLLCIDDDMVFRGPDVQRLIDYARASGNPTSAVALKIERLNAVVAARPRQSPIAQLRMRWLTGLAMMAIPRRAFFDVASRLPVVGGIRAWCQTGAHPNVPNEWIGEDFWFCEHFGGVELLPIGVGHCKPLELVPWLADEARAQGLERVTLWPDALTMREIRAQLADYERSHRVLDPAAARG